MDTAGSFTGEQDTIYIVDPDESHCARVSTLLEGLGYRTLVFHTGEDFLDHLIDAPDVLGIIAEIDLPGIDGLQMLHRLNNRKIEAPVIFITGHENMSTAVKACRMHVADYLVKPVLGKTIVDRLRKVLEKVSVPAK
jgi:FixJ family two-component response regulator